MRTIVSTGFVRKELTDADQAREFAQRYSESAPSVFVVVFNPDDPTAKSYVYQNGQQLVNATEIHA